MPFGKTKEADDPTQIQPHLPNLHNLQKFHPMVQNFIYWVAAALSKICREGPAILDGPVTSPSLP